METSIGTTRGNDMTTDRQARELVDNIDAAVAEGRLDLSDEQLSERDGLKFDINRIHPDGVQNLSPSEVFDYTEDQIEATLQGNEGALLRPSTHKPFSRPRRTSDEDAQVRTAAQALAAISNPASMQRLDPNAASTYKNLLEAMKDLPVPDSTVWVDNRRVTVPGEVITVPNNIPKKGAIRLLEQLLGGECKGDKRHADGTMTKCECPTHKVCRTAQSFGMRDKPHVWLSQHLYTDSKRKEVKLMIARGNDYNPDADGRDEAPAPKAIATLFSWANSEPLMELAESKQRNILDVFRQIVNHIVTTNMELTRPKEFDDRFAM